MAIIMLLFIATKLDRLELFYVSSIDSPMDGVPYSELKSIVPKESESCQKSENDESVSEHN